MADRVLPGTVESTEGAAACSCPTDCVNIHTRKIFDACKDKDCIEDLRVYPTIGSQALIDCAFSVRPNSAELIYVDVDVDEISFNRGYYTVDVTYFYVVTGNTFPGGNEVKGLAIFEKRVILFGSDGCVKVFSSGGNICNAVNSSKPVAFVEAVDPIALNMKIVEPGCCTGSDSELRSIPNEILETIGEEVVLSSCGRKLYATLGQFSIIRLERDTLLSLDDVRYYLPQKDCVGSSEDDPCSLFSRVRFPVEEFFPPDCLPCDADYHNLV
ncbi:MAG: hypothetical protein IKV47_02835 [Oscillospiraceae bacterium]|nr:hypothetical protein [Oscillospiraceae bacterium]